MPLNVTPFTKVKDHDTEDRANGGDFTNSYTRLRITSFIHADGRGAGSDVVNLRYEPRHWLKRYFWSKEFEANLSTKIRIGAYEATVPLVTISHQSDSNGEQWSRTVSKQLLDFPLFLVRGDGEASIPVIQVKMAGSKEYASKMAGKALESVLAGIQAVSPDSGVLTRLSAQSVKDKSAAVDVAIGRLFSNGLTEEHVAHRDLRRWHSKGGIQISFELPKENEDWDGRAGEMGTWEISFEEPRPSIFGDWRICDNDNGKVKCANSRQSALSRVHAQISPHQVLAYPLIKTNSELGTVGAFLIQQEWYGKAMSEFSGKADDALIADGMCLKIQNSIVGLGLNSDDADIVTWAFINGMPWAKNMERQAFRGKGPDGADSNCARPLKKINASRV